MWFGLVGFLWYINHYRLFNSKSSLYIYIKYIWFGWIGFYGISKIVGYLMPNLLYTYILNIYDLVGWFLWRINNCRLFNSKSSLYIYIIYIWFGWAGFYGISTILGYCQILFIHIYLIYNLVCLNFMSYQPLRVI